MTAGSPLGGAVAPGGGGGGGGTVTLSGNVTGLSNASVVEKIYNVPVDFDGETPLPGRALITETVSSEVRIRTGARDITRVFYDEGNLTAVQPTYNTFSGAFAAAEELLLVANGPVEIVVLHDNDPPAFPSGTYNCQGLIEIVGSPAVKGDRITATIASGFVLRNPRALRNLYIEVGGMSAPWLDTSAATNLNLILDNTQIVDNAAGADMCTLAASTTGNKLQLINGAIYSGDSYAFTTLSSGKIITVYLDSGVLNGETFHGSAGAADVYLGTAGTFDTQAGFSGTVTVVSDVTTALGQVTTAVGFNSQRLTSVASPTSGTDAANRTFTLQQGCDLIYDQGGVAGPRTFTSLAAAVTAAASIPGKVRIGIKATSGTPTTTGVTYALDRRIELVGLQPTGAFGQGSLVITSGAVLQDACAFRNLGIEHDLGAAWLTASSDGIVCEFDNVAFVDNGATANICTLNASSGNFFTLKNGTTIANGGTGPLFTLASGKTVYLTLEGNSAFGDNTATGSAGTLTVTQGGSATFGSQSTFSGTLNRTHQGVASLAQANASVSVNSQKITSLAYPTSATEGANRGYVDSKGSLSVAGSGTATLSQADTQYGVVEFTGALTGDKTISLPSETRTNLFVNSTTGDYTLKVGSNVYLLPGQSKRIASIVGAGLYGEGLNVLELNTLLDLSSGYTVGTHDVTLCTIPAATAIDRVEIRCNSGLSSGTATVAVGVSGSYNQLIVATACNTAGDVVGLDTSHAGSDFTSKIAAFYSSGQTVKIRIVVSGGTLTAGSYRVRIVGHYLGG